MNDKELKQFVKDRDEAVESLDIAKFKEFYRKYLKKGVYNLPLPSDSVIEITIRQMAIYSTDVSEKVKAEAKEWLTSRGCSTDIF